MLPAAWVPAAFPAAPEYADIKFDIICAPSKKILGLFGGKKAQVKASYEKEEKPKKKPAKAKAKKAEKKPVKKETEKKLSGLNFIIGVLSKNIDDCAHKDLAIALVV